MSPNFDVDVIIRAAVPVLRRMTFTLTLTAFATTGGVIFGTLLAMMRRIEHCPALAVRGRLRQPDGRCRCSW
jgi:ABC-type amino acid transport system permease subunit